MKSIPKQARLGMARVCKYSCGYILRLLIVSYFVPFFFLMWCCWMHVPSYTVSCTLPCAAEKPAEMIESVMLFGRNAAGDCVSPVLKTVSYPGPHRALFALLYWWLLLSALWNPQQVWAPSVITALPPPPSSSLLSQSTWGCPAPAPTVCTHCIPALAQFSFLYALLPPL